MIYKKLLLLNFSILFIIYLIRLWFINRNIDAKTHNLSSEKIHSLYFFFSEPTDDILVTNAKKKANYFTLVCYMFLLVNIFLIIYDNLGELD
jgi:hypothetical protein